MWLCRVHHIQIYHNDWHQPSWSNSEQHQFLEKRIYLKQKDWHLMSGICGNIRVTNNLADQRIPLFEAFCHIITFYDVHLNLFPGSSSELWWEMLFVPENVCKFHFLHQRPYLALSYLINIRVPCTQLISNIPGKNRKKFT